MAKKNEKKADEAYQESIDRVKELQSQLSRAETAAKRAEDRRFSYLAKVSAMEKELARAQANGWREAESAARKELINLKRKRRFATDEARTLSNRTKYIKENLELNQEELKVFQEREKKEQKILARKTEAFRDIAKTLANIPGIGGLLSDVFSDAASEIEKTGKVASGLKSVFVSISSVAGPAALLKTMLDVSDQTKQLSQNLGIGFEASRKIREEFSQISKDANDVRINSERLLQAQLKLTEAFGLSVRASSDVSENFIRNSRYLGASEEAAGNLERIIAATGQDSTKFTNALAGAANESGKLYGINLPLAKVVENIKDLQGEVLISLMRSPEALTKAVAISEKLGIEFSKIKDIAGGLTDFESSITSELEAEVLLGREINLNRARQLAFTGQYAQLGEELTKQVGTLAEYENMFPIQRAAFAKAIGMSSDELGNMLLKQELSVRFGKQAKDLSEEQLKAARALADNEGISDEAALRRIQEEASATERFEDAALKVKSAFQDFVVKLAPFIEKLGSMLGTLAKNPMAKFIAVGATAIGTVLGAKKLFQGLTPASAMWVRDVTGGAKGAAGMTGTGFFGGVTGTNKAGKALTAAQKRMIITKGGTRSYARGMAGRFAGSMGGGMALGGVGMLAGNAISERTNSAMGSAFGQGLSMAGQGAMLGSMILPGWGTAIGAGIGALYGGVTGYLDKKEAERQARQEQIQKEIDERGAVAEELRMLREVMENKDMVLEMNGMEVGKGMTKGADLIRYNYNTGG